MSIVRPLMLSGIGLFLLATLPLAPWPRAAWDLVVAIGLWGLFSRVPTLLQTALARRGGASTDLAQSMLVTGWNLAIAGGGLLLDHLGAASLAWTVLPLLLLTTMLALPARGWRWAAARSRIGACAQNVTFTAGTFCVDAPWYTASMLLPSGSSTNAP